MNVADSEQLASQIEELRNSIKKVISDIEHTNLKIEEVFTVVSPMQINIANLLKANISMNSSISKIHENTTSTNGKQIEFQTILSNMIKSLNEANELINNIQLNQGKNIDSITFLNKEKDRINKDLLKYARELQHYISQTKANTESVNGYKERFDRLHGMCKTTIHIAMYSVGAIGVLSFLNFLKVFEWFGIFVKWLFSFFY